MKEHYLEVKISEASVPRLGPRTFIKELNVSKAICRLSRHVR
jgi:hypothetical protein